MYIFRSVDQTFVQCFEIIHLYTFDISIHQNRSGIVAHHTTTMSGTCPFGEETAFLISIDQTFLHFFRHGRIHQVQEREQTTESIPETSIRKHIARQYFSIIRTIMYNFP